MSDSSEEDAGVVVGEVPATMVPKHIKKRSLRNKSLTISFDEKNLRDFVTGFHKRKKKRRKVAKQQLEEKERKKRLEARKQRKLERDMALNGGQIPENSEPDEVGGNGEEDEVDLAASVSETKTYETADTTIRVITSELSREEEEFGPMLRIAPKLQRNIQENHNLSAKKNLLKRGKGQKPGKKAGKGTFRNKNKWNK